MQHCGRQRALLNLLREANYVPRVAKLSTTKAEGNGGGEGSERENNEKAGCELVVGSCDIGYK